MDILWYIDMDLLFRIISVVASILEGLVRRVTHSNSLNVQCQIWWYMAFRGSKTPFTGTGMVQFRSRAPSDYFFASVLQVLSLGYSISKWGIVAKCCEPVPIQLGIVTGQPTQFVANPRIEGKTCGKAVYWRWNQWLVSGPRSSSRSVWASSCASWRCRSGWLVKS